MTRHIDSLMFTPSAQRALGFARAAALSLQQPYVGPEHILYGLLREHRSMAAQILVERGLDLSLLREYTLLGLRQEASARAKKGSSKGGVSEGGASKKTPGTPAHYSRPAKKVFVQAARRASRLGHETIGTEHLFLGVLETDSGFGASVLKQRGVNADELYHDVLLSLDNEQPTAVQRYLLPVSLSTGAVVLVCALCVASILIWRRQHSSAGAASVR